MWHKNTRLSCKLEIRGHPLGRHSGPATHNPPSRNSGLLLYHMRGLLAGGAHERDSGAQKLSGLVLLLSVRRL
jgi:hypothetical protein